MKTLYCKLANTDVKIEKMKSYILGSQKDCIMLFKIYILGLCW